MNLQLAELAFALEWQADTPRSTPHGIANAASLPRIIREWAVYLGLKPEDALAKEEAQASSASEITGLFLGRGSVQEKRGDDSVRKASSF